MIIRLLRLHDKTTSLEYIYQGFTVPGIGTGTSYIPRYTAGTAATNRYVYSTGTPARSPLKYICRQNNDALRYYYSNGKRPYYVVQLTVQYTIHNTRLPTFHFCDNKFVCSYSTHPYCIRYGTRYRYRRYVISHSHLSLPTVLVPVLYKYSGT